ncbi:AMP-binding enzyme [Oricola indica]|uniref:AMP-binding enzyme n=1 Tax=Oricola indica TaxID=2872591 RepID=UPI003CCC05E8
MFIAGDENLLPVEVESRLSLHPGVELAAMFGLPDERRGKISAAHINSREEASEQKLDARIATTPAPRTSSVLANTCASPNSRNSQSASFCAE